MAEVRSGRRCLVLTDRKDHLEVLTQRLAAAGCDPEVLVGGTGKRVRAHVLDRVRALEPDEGFVLVATGRYIGEGFDCPPLDTLFLTFPISFRGRVVQYTGRILRPSPGKTTARVHDYADSRVRVLARMLDRRMNTYAKLGFKTVAPRSSRADYVYRPSRRPKPIALGSVSSTRCPRTAAKSGCGSKPRSRE